MRILSVGNMYPPHHYGGYELVWQAAVEHLRGLGHEVVVLTTDTRTDAADAADPHVHRELRWRLRDGAFEPLGRRARVAMVRSNHRVLERHLDSLRPDVVTWWSMGGLTLTMLEEVRRRRIPAVAFVIDDWLDYGRWADGWTEAFARRPAVVARLAELVLRVPTRVDFAAASAYVFTSDYVRRHALGLGLGLGEESTGVAPCGIDPAFLRVAGEQPWAWRLLYVGRLDPRKGVETAIEALVHLPQEARLRIVGGWDAVEEKRLRGLAASSGVVDRVEFAGQRARDELIAAYGQADVTVFPVVWEEPWGLVPLESMARGRPVVATGRGGSGEYLRDGENCLLFDAGDPRDLAAAVRRLAGDPTLRRRLREGGLETAPRHTTDRFNEAVADAVFAAADRSDPAAVGRAAR